MWWIPLLTAAAGAYMGAQKNKHDQEIEDAQRKLQSNLTRYSWVNGAIQGDPSKIPHANSMFGDIGQGAMSGAMFGSQFMGNNPKQPAPGQGYQNQNWYQQLQNQDTLNQQRPQYYFGDGMQS